MILADFHNHTHFSGDSNASVESMVEKAIDLGLQYLCITDHMDLDFPYTEPVFEFSPAKYFQKHQELRERYASSITLLTGIELGLQPHLEKQLQDLLSSWPFDFVIGSSHLIDRLDPFLLEYWQNTTEEASILRYFETILENLQAFSSMDVYGHIDYIIRYAPSKAQNYSYKKYQEILDEILKTLVQKNVGIEINTAGFKYGLGFPNPHPDIIRRYWELGGEIITIGSDGHCPDHLAYDFQKIPDLLKSCGFHYYTIFQNRKPEFIKL